MKKYLSFALMLVMAFVFGGHFVPAKIAKADTTSTTGATVSATSTARYEFNLKLKAAREALQQEIEAKRAAFQTTLKTERDAFKKEVETEKADFKAHLSEKRAEFRGHALEMVGKRFEALMNNITKLQVRVADRITKLKAAGNDTSKAEVSLALSKSKLADAQAKITAIKALIPTTDVKVTADTFSQIKLGANDAKNLLKEAHAALVDAITLLKGLKSENTPTSTTTK
jgi:chromosome segregation ATPase